MFQDSRYSRCLVAICFSLCAVLDLSAAIFLPNAHAANIKISGFMRKNSDPQEIVIDNGSERIHLKRQYVFLKNQLELKKAANRPAPAWVTLEVEPKDIIRKTTSPDKKSSAEAI